MVCCSCFSGSGRTAAQRARTREDLLAEQLRMLVQTTPHAPHWSYLGEVGALLREYLVVRCGISLKYQGGSAHFFDRQR